MISVELSKLSTALNQLKVQADLAKSLQDRSRAIREAALSSGIVNGILQYEVNGSSHLKLKIYHL